MEEEKEEEEAEEPMNHHQVAAARWTRWWWRPPRWCRARGGNGTFERKQDREKSLPRTSTYAPEAVPGANKYSRIKKFMGLQKPSPFLRIMPPC